MIAGGLANLIPARRAPQAASVGPAYPVSSHDLAGILGAQENVTGEMVNEHSALAVSAVYCAVNMIAGSLGIMPHCVMQSDGDETSERAYDDYRYPLLNAAPNDEMTAMTFFATTAAHALLWGNTVSEIERTRGGKVGAIWPIEPSRVRVDRTRESKRLVYDISEPGNSNEVLEVDDVVHVPGLGFNGVRGYSVVGFAQNTIGTSMAAEKAGGAMFGNGCMPSAIVSHPGEFSKEGRDRFRTDVEAGHRGARRAGRLLILEEGMKWESTLTMPFKDMQFLESRQFGIPEVARWFNIQVHKLKDLMRATDNNIEQQNLEYLTDTLLPWIVRYEQEFNRKLFTPAEVRGGLFMGFIVDGILRADIKTRFEAYASGIDHGFMTPDEARQREGWKPFPSGVGNIPMRPVNMTPAAEIAARVSRIRASGGAVGDVEFLREVVKAFLADKTTNDVVYNMTRVESLLDAVGIPREPGVKAPFMPVVGDQGPLVSGDTIKDPEGDVVGGNVVKPEGSKGLRDQGTKGDEAAAPAKSGEPAPGQNDQAEGSAAASKTPQSLSPSVPRPSSLAPLFSEAFGRMLRIENTHAGRKSLTARFWSEHAARVRAALGGLVDFSEQLAAAAEGRAVNLEAAGVRTRTLVEHYCLERQAADPDGRDDEAALARRAASWGEWVAGAGE